MKNFDSRKNKQLASKLLEKTDQIKNITSPYLLKVTQFFKSSSLVSKLNFIGSLTSKTIVQITATSAVATASLFLTEASNLTSFIKPSKVEKPALGALAVVNPTVKYGFALDTFHVVEAKVKSDDVFGVLFSKRGISAHMADSLAKTVKSSYDFDKIQDGKLYTFLSKDPHVGYDYFIFEPDAKRYLIFDLKTPSVKEVKRDVEVREFQVSGKIKEHLWESLVSNGLSYELTDMVEDALKYQVDLRKFKKGDEYKIIWDEEIVDGRGVGVKTMKAAYFKKQEEEKPIYAIYYDNKSEKGWYSKNGLPMRDGFLKSPLRYSNITSYYSMNRFHPILHYNRPHFGTDYAAPQGTPIMSVADGVVEEARYDGGNGNYVKIKHIKPYETQYLHMSRFAKGIKPGTSVKQGEVIGYVGSTGLATGPHVCFRFWKSGVQVNHLAEKLPQVSTFASSDVYKFKLLSEELITRLDKVPFLDEMSQKEQKKVFMALRGKP
jgi:murein DD-endopeptidase MepM/ murein hydrolase activator NlpD